MISQTENTVVVTSKVKIPDKFSPLLDSLSSRSLAEVKEMLKDRTKASSKYFKSIPCVVAKGLITKYQKNKKCVAVKNIVIPICGDKGKQVKVDGNLLRVPVLFKKETIKIYPTKPIHGFIRQVEFFKRKGEWFMSYSYNTKALDKTATGYLGVDRNQRDNIATIADLESGKVRRLGIDIQLWKENLKRRKAKLQRKRKFKLLKKLKRKQANRTKELNHKVSKQIVDYAKKHCKVIVLENLKNIRNSEKYGRSVQRSNWSYAQLESFISYKASLLGIPVIYVRPEYTSKMCSRCGKINEPNSKSYKCSECGHKDHRDANASFNIAIRGKKTYGIPEVERFASVGCIDTPLTSKGRVC